MSSAAPITPVDRRADLLRAVVPPLEHGDHLSREEFYRRWDAMPELKRAERLGGVVFMEASVRPRPSLNSVDPAVPPLANGERLDRAEFQRRRAAMPHLNKAERLAGVVYMNAAVRFREHGNPHAHVVTWLGNYEAATPGVGVADNTTLEFRTDDDAQSDAALLILPEFGGQCSISSEGYIEGGPELIAEVAASSASYDLYEKLETYRRNRVREYLVWKVLEREIVCFELRGADFVERPPDGDGILRSSVFPGLWLDVQAMLDDHMARVLQVLQRGIASPAHAEFVRRLAPRHTTEE